MSVFVVFLGVVVVVVNDDVVAARWQVGIEILLVRKISRISQVPLQGESQVSLHRGNTQLLRTNTIHYH